METLRQRERLFYRTSIWTSSSVLLWPLAQVVGVIHSLEGKFKKCATFPLLLLGSFYCERTVTGNAETAVDCSSTDSCTDFLFHVILCDKLLVVRVHLSFLAEIVNRIQLSAPAHIYTMKMRKTETEPTNQRDTACHS